MEQKYTSAETSMNSSKLPKIYSLFDFENGSIVFDYGCGKYTSHIQEKMEQENCIWFGYDKYNQSEETNTTSLKALDKGCDIGICSNVLNVIDSIEVIKEIILKLVRKCEKVIFTIYEGNGTGIGKESRKNCWQRNEKIDSYIKLMQSMGVDPVRKGKLIIIE